LATLERALSPEPGNGGGRSMSVAGTWTSNKSAVCDIDRFERRVPLRAEHRLLHAVLLEAVYTFQRYVTSVDTRGRRLFSEAEAWFDSGDTTRLFSFIPICDVLGLSATSLRTGLRQWWARCSAPLVLERPDHRRATGNADGYVRAAGSANGRRDHRGGEWRTEMQPRHAVRTR
jgi:hypothetical protein